MISNLLSGNVMISRLGQNSQAWVRRLIIGGALLASAYLAPRGSGRAMMMVVGVVSVFLFLQWPPLGLLALVFASLVVPFSINTGTATTINVTSLLLPLLLGLWMVNALTRRERPFFHSRPFLPLLALSLVAILSFINGNQVFFVFGHTAPLQAQLGGLAIFLLSAAAFFLVGQQMRDVRWLQRLTWLFLALGGVYVVGRLVPGVRPTVDRIYPNAATAGSMFWVWVAALAFGQAVCNRILRLPWRCALGGLAIATLAAGFFQAREWTSGWLPPLVALMVILWVGRPRLGLLATIAGGIAVALNLGSVADVLFGGSNSYSVLTRLEAWRVLEEIVKASPLLGFGPANYYWYTPLFPILGWHVSFNSHNNYIDIVAQAGLLGLICFLWFAWEVGRLGFRLRATMSPGFGQGYACGALGGLAGMLVAGMLADWVIPFVYNIGLSGFRTSVLGWMFLGGLVALQGSSHEQPGVGHELEDNSVEIEGPA